MGCNNDRLRIALLAPYPIRMYHSERLEFRKKESIEHPASWVVNMLRFLADRPDMDTHLITLGTQLKKDAHFSEGVINFHLLKGIRFSLQALSLYQPDLAILKRELNLIKPDVVEAFGTEGPYGYAGVTSKYPCVVYMQGIVSKLIGQNKRFPMNLEYFHLFITQFFERRTIRLGRHFIVENAFAKDFVSHLNSQANIYEIPNLINPLFFRIEQDWSSPRFNILFVGNVTDRKGILDLLVAFHKVNIHFPECRLIIVGGCDPNYKLTLEKYLIDNGLYQVVQFFGLQNAQYVAKVMQNTAVFVHPALLDFSPNTIYEAMAAGLPVIATCVGGIPSIVKDKETGLLVEPHNPSMLAEKIIFLMQNPSEKFRLGENAKQDIRSRLAPDRIFERIISLYKTVALEQR